MQQHQAIPKTTIVPPVLVKTPHAETFCFVRVFCIEDTRAPAPPVIAVALSAALIASLGWYTGSSSRAETTFGIVNVWQPKEPAQEDVLLETLCWCMG